MTFCRRQILAENVALARAKAAAKERKEHKGGPFGLLFFAIYVFFCGYTSG